MNGLHLLGWLGGRWRIGALFALALLAGGFGLAIFFRRRRRAKEGAAAASDAALPMSCPSCHRQFPLGARFCPLDATRLQHGQASGLGDRGGICPRCRRMFAGMRFCPMDAEELVPSAHAAAHGAQLSASGLGAAQSISEHLAVAGPAGKICPLCASKYDLAAGYCGRDAAELVPIN